MPAKPIRVEPTRAAAALHLADVPGARRSEAPALEPRAERVRALRQLMGTPDRSVRHLALAIRSTAHRHFGSHVDPLVETSWPGLKGQPFYQKLRIGACDLYASAPYTALFCAPRRPLLIRAVTRLGNRSLLIRAVTRLGNRLPLSS